MNVIWAVDARLGHGPEDVPPEALESPLMALVVYPPYTSFAIATLLSLIALGLFFVSGYFDAPADVILEEKHNER